MLQKITLNLGGADKTFQQPVNARMCRTAYDARLEYAKDRDRAKGVMTHEMQDKLVDWLVEAFGGQFTADQFWDGYSGSFLEIANMMDEMITEVSSAVNEFPKRRPEA